ncbi:GerAB/ArcD/ProY family transporter [Metabacillus sp. 84]|uniref:GerAB/ArcD/ProY family transporter n=1 Tax=unclassified Metabacillus TaxID=2675274 RepID=UPI003CF0B828
MNNRVTVFQLYFFIIQTQIGVGILGLPFEVQMEAKGNAWISILLSGVLIQLILTLYWLLAKRYPNQNLYEYSPQLLGRFFGGATNLLYGVYGIAVMAVILIFAVGVIKDWVLDETPRWIILAMICLVGVYLGKEKPDVIAKFHVIVSGLILLLLVITIIALFNYPLEIRYLFPITQTGVKEILNGVTKVYFSMIGFELLLIIYPYMKARTSLSILKSASLANVTVTSVYAYLTVVCQIVFSPREMEIIPQPILYLVKALYIHVVERFDLLFVSIWVVNVATSYISYLFLTLEGMKAVFKKAKRSFLAYLICASTFLFALLITKEEHANFLNDLLLKATVFFLLFVPFLLLGLSLIISKMNRKRST